MGRHPHGINRRLWRHSRFLFRHREGCLQRVTSYLNFDAISKPNGQRPHHPQAHNLPISEPDSLAISKPDNLSIPEPDSVTISESDNLALSEPNSLIGANSNTDDLSKPVNRLLAGTSAYRGAAVG